MKKIGVVGILGHEKVKITSELEQSKNAYEVNQENGEWFPAFDKAKTIDKLMKEKRNNAMKTYTEEDVKSLTLNAMISVMQEYSFHNESTVVKFHEEWVNEYIESLNPQPKEENKIPMTYGFLRSRISWEKFCDITGIDYYAKKEGYTIEDDEIFYLTESQVKDLF